MRDTRLGLIVLLFFSSNLGHAQEEKFVPPPTVEAETLSGEISKGELLEFTPQSLKLKTATGELSIKSTDLLEIRFEGKMSTSDAALGLLELHDGSQVGISSAIIENNVVTCVSPKLLDFKVPLGMVRSLRLSGLDPRFDEAWGKYREKEIKSDLLVYRKPESLDFLDGVVGEIDENGAKILFEEEELTVKRDKLYGVIYPAKKVNQKSICDLKLTGGDRLRAGQLELTPSSWKVTLAGGGIVMVPFDQVDSLDFSRGRVLYLGDINPREEEYVPYFDVTWKLLRNKNQDGGPLRVGSKSFQRGLCIHSKSTLSYRLAGDYRRFQAVAGIDALVAPRGDVILQIYGDEKQLFTGTIKGTDEPLDLNLDVSGVRDLRILVDFGGELDIADHLDLGDARVLK